MDDIERLTGKETLVTGAAAGIGRSTALAFARSGARVHVVDKDRAGLQALCDESPQLIPHTLNLVDGGAAAALVERIGEVDVLFNCAGRVPNGTLLDCNEAAWDSAFELNVKVTYRLCRAFLPGMLRRGAGNIINMASVAGVTTAAPNRCAYSASKAAVVGLTRAIACDFVKSRIRCNAVCPGTVDTPSLNARLAAFDDPLQARRDFEARQPMGRLGRPEEIAALVVYLASDASAFVTGQTFVIDGGWSNG
ncbi:MAG: SDR family oxidoreductase [Gammaproteobacteria bacterium]|nr:SDR family oxidoreductase [Gammaproteobacteria bacterium]